MYNELYKYFAFTAPDPNENNADDSDAEVLTDSTAEDVDGSVTICRKGKFIHCLTVIGQIEGHYNLPQNTKATNTSI